MDTITFIDRLFFFQGASRQKLSDIRAWVRKHRATISISQTDADAYDGSIACRFPACMSIGALEQIELDLQAIFPVYETA